MKIAMIGQKRIPSREGGVEVVVEELSTRMVKKGHQVTCYNRKGKHALDKNIKFEKIKEYKGVKMKSVITIDIKGLSALSSSFFSTIRATLAKYDVLHFHAEGPCFWLWIPKFFSKKRLIVTIHGLDWQRAKWGGIATRIIKFGEKQAVKYADEIIVLSKSVQKYFLENYNRKTNYIPNGVNIPIIRSAKIISKKYNLKKDDYVLFLGRIVPEKGVHYLIKAFTSINTEKKLVIAGGASDTDDYFNELRKSTKSNDNIIFTGFVQGKVLEELYSNAYLYCLPSDVEGMPLSLLEAMSYGNCCLTSNIDECAEVVQNHGITFKKSDADDLKIKLINLLENTDIVKKKKKESQSYVIENYNWNSIVDNTLTLYEEAKK